MVLSNSGSLTKAESASSAAAPAQLDFTLWLWWILASAAGGAVAGALLSADFWPVLLLFGTVFAVPQWLVLRHYQDSAVFWVPFTGGGVILAWLAAIPAGYVALIYVGMTPPSVREALPSSLTPVALSILPGAVAGLVVGSVQHLILEFSHPPKRWWLAASALGGVALGQMFLLWVRYVIDATAFGLGYGRELFFPSLGMIGGAVYGITTGFVLGRFSFHSARDRDQASQFWTSLAAGCLAVALISGLVVESTESHERAAAVKQAESVGNRIHINMTLQRAHGILGSHPGLLRSVICPYDEARASSRLIFLYGRSPREEESSVLFVEASGPRRSQVVSLIRSAPNTGQVHSEEYANCRSEPRRFWD